MKKLLLGFFLIVIFYLIAGIAIIDHEREKITNYLIYDQEGSEYFISYNEREYYLAGFEIPDEVLLKNETDEPYKKYI